MPVPVIDLFAGPGGLGEGFSQYGWRESDEPFFRIHLSVEKEKSAHRTLLLRAFFRQFAFGKAPQKYYEFPSKGASPEEVLKLREYKSQYRAALKEALCAELGSGKAFNRELDSKIEKALATENSSHWVLIGGPPCQAYSLMGRARNKGVEGYVPEEDHRHFLYREYLRIIAVHSPSVFIMENVKGILSSNVNGYKIFNKIREDLENPGGGHRYRLFSLTKSLDLLEHDEVHDLKNEDFVIRAEKFGIPQSRHRVIVFGIREDLTGIAGRPGILAENENSVPAGDVLALPALRSGISRGKFSGEDWLRTVKDFPLKGVSAEASSKEEKSVLKVVRQALRNLEIPGNESGGDYIAGTVSLEGSPLIESWYRDSRLKVVLNHSARSHMVSDLHRYFFSACFAEALGRTPRMHEFPEVLKPAHKNRDSGHFADRFKVQLSDKPSSTVTSHISKDGHYYIHPDPLQCRSLTVREAARLQTFPDNYFFCGNRTQQYVQVGNAVPPLLAYGIAEIVSEFIGKVRTLNG